MTGSWLIVKWVCGAVWVAYFVFQVATIRCLHGEARTRSVAVLRFMVIAMLLANGTRLFDSQAIKRTEFVILSGLGIGAIAVLWRLFRSEARSAES